ncbi:UNVERIFIED_ORG: transposase-like protein [Rhizobium etli]
MLVRPLKKKGLSPKRIVSDKLRAHMEQQGAIECPGVEHRSHKGVNNRAENSHLPLRKRERVMQGFRFVEGLQRFISVFSAGRIFSPRTVNAQPWTPTFIEFAQWRSEKL